MGGLRKFLQILFSLLVLLAVVATASIIYPIPYVSDFVDQYIVSNQMLVNTVIVLLSLAFIYFAVALIWALEAPAKSRTLKVSNDFGEVKVNRDTVVNAVHQELLDVKQVSHKDVTVKFGRKPENTKVTVNYAVDKNQAVQTISNKIQEKASLGAERVIGTNIQNVKVSAAPYDASQVSQQGRGQNQARVR
ncbi:MULTISPECIES: alkaline shock response membrane anchor protein AmaP [unclassified Aerococcus]|uniref:alkaline shock response membrane anchor protein AmaP n=1 Tax=unclassified Aerococcus TaxID=2618060 RepID=UPI0025C2A630|nr:MULTISPECIES: alkaline shock response membrane anchor protein AmaP [unclassified Aerococcus]